MRIGIVTLTAGLALIGAAAALQAQTPVRWTVTATTLSSSPGERAELTLAASIDAGWHIYSLSQGPGGPVRTTITVPAGQLVALAAKVTPVAPPLIQFDGSFGIEVESYEDSAKFLIPVEIAKTATSGAHHVEVAVRYQVCNAQLCLPARTEKVRGTLTVKSGAGHADAYTRGGTEGVDPALDTLVNTSAGGGVRSGSIPHRQGRSYP